MFQEYIQHILNDADPMNIFIEEAPDEYASEAREIATRVAPDMEIEEIASLVHAVFIQFFDEDLAGSRERYLEIAEKIHRLFSV